MKKFKALICLTIVSTMALAGCSGGQQTTTDPTETQVKKEENKEAQENQDSKEKVTLRMIESLTSPERTAVLREIADKYQNENPNVTIEIISPPLDGADQKIAQMLMAKQPLDIVEVREQTVTQFYNNGWIAALDDYVKDWEGNATLTEAAKIAMTQIGDAAYLIPYGFYQRALFYRKDLFEAAGIEKVPTSWDEIYEAGLKLTDPANNKYGWSFRGGAGGVNYIDMLYWDYLGADKIADPTAAYFTPEGKTIFTTPEAKEALAFHKKLFEEISPKDSIAWSFSEMVQGFISGTTAMLIQDPEVIATCVKELDDSQWGLAPMPVGPSGQSFFPNGYAGWGMTAYTEHPDVASDFLLFLSNVENNTYFAKNYSTIPIHSTAADIEPYFKEGPFSVYLEMAKQPDVYKFAAAPQAYVAFGEHNATVDQWYQKYLNGTITADELLEYLNDYWSTALEKEGQKW